MWVEYQIRECCICLGKQRGMTKERQEIMIADSVADDEDGEQRQECESISEEEDTYEDLYGSKEE